MPKSFKYRAIDSSGKIRSDCLEAENLLELEQRINSMGLELINYKVQKPGLFGARNKSIKRQDLINFTFQMEQLTKSGVSILEGLADLRDSLPEGRMHEVLSSVISEIEGGKTFSQALNCFPGIFDSVYVTLVRVGEESGRLSDVLKDLAETLKWHDELIAHTKKIMIYPAIVTLVVIAVVTFLMIVLIPQLIPFLEDIGGEIPFHTRALIWTSNFMGSYWYLIFGTPVVIYLLLSKAANKNPALRYKIDSLKLKMWLFGPLMLKTNLSRFANYLAMMYNAGLTVLDALKISEKLVDNAVLTQAVIDARSYIEEGELISNSFKNVKIYPPLVIRMLKVGENTGALDEALLNVSYFYNREVKETVGKMESAITPVLTVILGGIMAWIMMSVMGPVYDSMTKIMGN
ncbi:MAG: type II secretion system F family protein [Gammaproteobacteria bacterium]|nr:type II secretion system F family protein [Gammaproteobacteria bacterium]